MQFVYTDMCSHEQPWVKTKQEKHIFTRKLLHWFSSLRQFRTINHESIYFVNKEIKSTFYHILSQKSIYFLSHLDAVLFVR